jgi:hypothetical protein
MQAELVLEPGDAEARRVRGQDERRDLRVAVRPRPGPGGDDVGARLAGVGDEALAAFDDPLAAVAVRPRALEGRRRAGPAGVGAGAGLGEAVRADDLAARHRDEELVLLGLRPGEMERAAAERGVGRNDEAEGAPDPADLFNGDRVGEVVEAGAALLLGDRDAEPARLAELLDDLDGEAPLALVLVDDRRDLLRHEVADRGAEELVLAREVEVHRAGA